MNKISILRNIIRRIIQESFKSDMSTLQFAENIYDFIIKELKRRPDKEFEEENMLEDFKFSIILPMYEEGPKPLWIVVHSLTSWSTRTESGSFNKELDESYDTIQIYIENEPDFSNDNISNKEDFINKVKQMKSTIVHEVAHFLVANKKTYKSDVIKGTTAIYKEKGFKAYLNTPDEYNSFYMMLINDLEEIMRDIERGKYPKEDIKQWFNDYKSFWKGIRFAVRYNYDWLDLQLDHGKWVDTLTDKYRKKFHKRLYKYFINTKKDLKDIGIFDGE